MGEEQKKTEYLKLIKLMKKLEDAMKTSRQKKVVINEMIEELYNETKPMMVEKRKEEINQKENEKIDFDNMTKDNLIRARKQIMKLKEESEKEYNEKFIYTNKQNEAIKTKLLAMKKRALETGNLELVEKSEESANKARNNLNNEIVKFKNQYNIVKDKLNKYENRILDYAEEIGAREEIDTVSIDELEEETVEKTTETEPIETKKSIEEEVISVAERFARKSTVEEPLQSEEKEVQEENVIPQPEEKEVQKENVILQPEKKVVQTENVKPQPKEKVVQKEDVKLEPEANEKLEIVKMVIKPFENKYSYTYKDSESKLITESKDFSNLTYNEDMLENGKELIKSTTKRRDIDSLSKAIDPNITQILDENSDKFNIDTNQYLDMLKGKKGDFCIEYDLRGIYDSNLDFKQIKNLNKIVKKAKKQTHGAISVQRDDKMLSRIWGNIKKRITYYTPLRIGPAKNEEAEKISNNKIGSILEKSKNVIVEKSNSIKRYTSEKLPRTTKAARGVVGTLKISATKVSGYIRKEDPLVTQEKVENIRRNAFRDRIVCEDAINHEVAIKNTEETSESRETGSLESKDERTE